MHQKQKRILAFENFENELQLEVNFAATYLI